MFCCTILALYIASWHLYIVCKCTIVYHVSYVYMSKMCKKKHKKKLHTVHKPVHIIDAVELSMNVIMYTNIGLDKGAPLKQDTFWCPFVEFQGCLYTWLSLQRITHGKGCHSTTFQKETPWRLRTCDILGFLMSLRTSEISAKENVVQFTLWR